MCTDMIDERNGGHPTHRERTQMNNNVCVTKHNTAVYTGELSQAHLIVYQNVIACTCELL